MKLRRLSVGLTRSQLGAVMGLTVWQVQRYESGRHRFSGPVLCCLAQVLNVSVNFFFDGMNKMLNPC
ncbi:MAG: helix-turn-helix transcriptional regulator [Rhodospirillaceae bacterium]|nr:helix-turn-helix transcriptional regulator [Rhodospirillales bacterium]